MYQASKVIEAVRELADKFPSAKYEREQLQSCFYTKGNATNGCCGCIMGQAILKVYPELEEKLRSIDQQKAASIGVVMAELNFTYSEQEENWMETLQNTQDNRDFWKNCVKTADQYWPLS